MVFFIWNQKNNQIRLPQFQIALQPSHHLLYADDDDDEQFDVKRFVHFTFSIRIF